MRLTPTPANSLHGTLYGERHRPNTQPEPADGRGVEDEALALKRQHVAKPHLATRAGSGGKHNVVFEAEHLPVLIPSRIAHHVLPRAAPFPDLDALKPPGLAIALTVVEHEIFH